MGRISLRPENQQAMALTLLKQHWKPILFFAMLVIMSMALTASTR